MPAFFGFPKPGFEICEKTTKRLSVMGGFDRFQVTTQDGYILSMQRIPEGRSGKTPGQRPPVLLQHGLLMVGNCSLNDRFPHNIH